jgi:6-phosphogluconolactonase
VSWTINKFDANDALVISLADRIAGDLRRVIKNQGYASMAVSGGWTPKSLFARLAGSELPWWKVTVTLVDERWVEESHPDANAKLVHDYLLQDKAANARFVPLKTPVADPFLAEAEVEARLRDIPLPFDVVLLGMGRDGHTASFLPGASTLRQALHPPGGELCCAVRLPASSDREARHDRMTLTLPVLLAAKHLVLHVVGKDKWQVLQKAFQPGAVEELPVRAVLHQSKVLLDIYYAAD